MSITSTPTVSTPTTPLLSLWLLGKPRIELDGRAVDGLRTTKAQALLFYLAVTGRAHTRHELAGLFWGEDGEENAKNSLRVALANLNKVLPDRLASDRLTVAFRLDQPHTIDAHLFAQQAQAVVSATEIDPDALQTLARICRGDFLLDFHVDGAPEFEAWLLREREHYHQLALTLLDRLGDALLLNRRYAEAVDAFTRLLALEPWDERAHQRLMLAYSRQGDYHRALAQYDRCRAVLEAELDVPPLPETQALYERIRTARQHQPAALPANPLPFVGREAELAEVGKLLQRPDCRLITLVGLGGSGKTRLALEAARRANREHAVDFINGVQFVSLVGVEAAAALPSVLVNALDITGSGRNQPQRELKDFLHNKEMLLVLDNFEQLLDGVDLLEDLLAHAPGIKLLVTSREPLGIASEWRIALVGMAYPPHPEDVHFAEYDAVRLFERAAQRVKPDFAVTDDLRGDVWRLCRAVDGMPLALRLAAPWLRAVTVAQIVQEVQAGLDILETQMRDAPPRQRSLRVVCEQSWARLSPAEQQLLCRLAVFRGGCTLDAAQAVAGATLARLAALVDRVLLRHTEPDRYEMHELIRQFADEKWRQMAGGHDDRAAAHSRYFADFAQAAYARYLAGEYPRVVADLSAERDNLRAAWMALVDALRRDPHMDVVETVTRFAYALVWFYRKRARYAEGIDALNAAEAALPQTADLPRAALQIYRASLIYFTGRYEETQTLVEVALPRAQAAMQPRLEAFAIDVLAKCTRLRGDYAKAKALAARVDHLYGELGDALGQMQAVVFAAVMAADKGDYALAESAGRRAMAFYRELNDTASLALTASNLANTCIRQGKYTKARPLLEEAYALAQAEGNLFTLMMTETNLGEVARALGEFEQAESYNREALARAREIGDRRWTAANLNALSKLYLRQDQWIAAERYAQEALAIRRVIPSELDMLGDLSCLARAWACRGDGERALRVLTFVQQHPSTVQVDRDQNQRFVETLRSQLPPELTAEIEAWCQAAHLDDVLAWVDAVSARDPEGTAYPVS